MYHSQVTVTVNDIPVKGSGSCSYSWDESKTPTVSAMSPTSGKWMSMYQLSHQYLCDCKQCRVVMDICSNFATITMVCTKSESATATFTLPVNLEVQNFFQIICHM